MFQDPPRTNADFPFIRGPASLCFSFVLSSSNDAEVALLCWIRYYSASSREYPYFSSPVDLGRDHRIGNLDYIGRCRFPRLPN